MNRLVIVEQISEAEKTALNISKWPIWTKEISDFDYEYDEDEECYILEGEVIVTAGSTEFLITVGDFVTFKKGLKCNWNIKKPIKKHYNFPG